MYRTIGQQTGKPGQQTSKPGNLDFSLKNRIIGAYQNQVTRGETTFSFAG